LNIYYREIEKTLHLLKKINSRSEHTPNCESELHHNHTFDYVSLNSSVNMSSHNRFSRQSSIGLDNFSSHPYFENMDNKILKELVAPDVTYQPLCIQYHELEADFELKFGLIHLLPKFHGLVGEDPHKHLMEFHVVCSTMKLVGPTPKEWSQPHFPYSYDGVRPLLENGLNLIFFIQLWRCEGRS